MSGGILDIAADLAALGVNPLPFLTTTDDVIRSFYTELVSKIIDRKKIFDQNLAAQIAEEVVRRFK